MTTLILLTKINADSQLNQISKALDFSFKGLEVETKILGVVADGWVQIALSGEDEGIATNYLIKEVGICPSNFGNVKKFSTLKGYIKNIGKNGAILSVDVGVFQPKIGYATIELRRLQAQLVDGEKIAIRKIAELFGLCEYLPVNVKVTGLNEEKSRIDAELSSKQIRKYMVWRESLLDRLLVLGSSLHEVKATIEHAKLERDVIDVEPLGLLEHALTCKLGTDAAGLIPKIGRTLRNAKFAVFNPKTLRDFLNT
ncbi:DUF2110 family protein [Candidatus Bathyarchaeota archaeon]|nr:DUF2110 family protein [Candidatus Bathyarchaeota archaeon]